MICLTKLLFWWRNPIAIPSLLNPWTLVQTYQYALDVKRCEEFNQARFDIYRMITDSEGCVESFILQADLSQYNEEFVLKTLVARLHQYEMYDGNMDYGRWLEFNKELNQLKELVDGYEKYLKEDPLYNQAKI